MGQQDSSIYTPCLCVFFDEIAKMVKFLPCSHKHRKHEVFPQYEFFHEFHTLESMQMFYCSIYKQKAFLRYEQFDEISHYWDFENVYHKSCIEMVFRYRG